ncbi:MAG TPA: sigma-54 dependent transcriptional regulator, partial [bacterium]|nr:sigma-54 dependent transcriptional regulator [bacterium]
MTVEKPPRVLIVDDDTAIRFTLRELLRKEGYETDEASNGRMALEMFDPEVHDVITLDLRMPKMGGMKILPLVFGKDPDAQVIVLTAHGGKQEALEAYEIGVRDFLDKPFDNDVLRITVRRALEKRKLLREKALLNLRVTALQSEIVSRGEFDTIVGTSPAMQQVRELIRSIAASDVTVLLCGESGTGKEVIAREIHRQSARASGPFIALNCAAIPETLLESELFGYEKGAFTGAVEQRAGKFELAREGTLLLDEIGDMPQSTQAKILRVLQEREFQRVGGAEVVKTDIRVLAATNQDLAALVREGSFREDLYFRLNVIPIMLPLLKDRREDLVLLAQHFIEKYNKQFSKKAERLGPKAEAALYAYDWPGNVRELENTIQRAVLLSNSPVIEELQIQPPPSPRTPRGQTLSDAFPTIQERMASMKEQIEREAILAALEQCRWRRAEA